MDFVTEFITAFIALFIVTDIIGTLPIFLSLTQSLNATDKVKSANLAVLIAGVLMGIFFFSGMFILNLLGISLSAFKVAGGVILGILGLQLVLGYYKAETLGKKSKDYSVAAIVIGTPMITGPGVISTIIILGTQLSQIPLIAAISANLLLTWLILIGGTKIYKFIGLNAIQIVSKVMGMLLAAVAVGYISSGIKGLIGG